MGSGLSCSQKNLKIWIGKEYCNLKDLERKVKGGLHDLLKELLQERKEARKM